MALFNTYSFEANTVPAYVIDTHLQRCATRKHSSSKPRHRDRWEEYLGQISNSQGSSAYFSEKSAASGDKLLCATGDTLDTAWGGADRLRSIEIQDFNVQVTAKNETAWRSYIEKVKAHYNFKLGHSYDSGASKWLRKEYLKEMDRWQFKWKPRCLNVLFNDQHLPILLRVLMVILCTIIKILILQILLSHQPPQPPPPPPKPQDYRRTTSSILNINLKTIELAYNIYIAYDDISSGKPIALMDPQIKIRLLLLDFFFLLLETTFTSISFNTVYNPSQPYHRACRQYHSHHQLALCRRHARLTLLQLAYLAIWLTVFSITIARIIRRVTLRPSPQRPYLTL